MGKRRIIAETGAGQHGVATATVCALYGLQCVVYMGAQDMARQSVNVRRMRMLGAQVRAVHTGTATLKDAMNEALRDWIANVADTYYLLGTGAGPHPYPWLVREFQRVIGDETREQILARTGACRCHGRLRRRRFERAGLLLSLPGRRGRADDRRGSGRAGPGQRRSRGQPGAGCPGVLHGCHSYYLQDEDGQIINAHSISAGLDYPGVGPEHALLHDRKRVDYVSVTDAQAVSAFHWLTRRQGILPALAPCAGSCARTRARMRPDDILIVCLSGRGDRTWTPLPNMARQHMNRLDHTLGALRRATRPGRLFRGGDPDPEASLALLRACRRRRGRDRAGHAVQRSGGRRPDPAAGQCARAGWRAEP